MSAVDILSPDMQYWRDDFFKTLVDIAADAAKFPDWADYAAFCLEYERGLRPQAFAVLERLLGKLLPVTCLTKVFLVEFLMSDALLLSSDEISINFCWFSLVFVAFLVYPIHV